MWVLSKETPRKHETLTLYPVAIVNGEFHLKQISFYIFNIAFIVYLLIPRFIKIVDQDFKKRPLLNVFKTTVKMRTIDLVTTIVKDIFYSLASIALPLPFTIF